MKKLSKEFWYIIILIIVTTIFSVVGDLMVLDITTEYFEQPLEIIIRVIKGE